MKKTLLSLQLIFIITYSFAQSGVNVTAGKPTSASTIEGPNISSNANDGVLGSRWSSAASNDEWWQVDLGSELSINEVYILWETAAGSAYEIQISNDPNFINFEVIATVTNGDGAEDLIVTDSTLTGRYLRMQGLSRLTAYGYSMFEIQAFSNSVTSNKVTLSIPYAQYLRLLVEPTDMNGVSELIIQNTELDTTLEFFGSPDVTLSLIEKRREEDINFWALNQNGDTVQGVPLATAVFDGLQLNVAWIIVINNNNKIPVADAGESQTIYLPQSATTLNGTGSYDPDGTIVSYEWSQLNGPSVAVFDDHQNVTTQVSGLEQGDYTFQLKVVDDSAASSLNTVEVHVEEEIQVDFELVTPANGAMITDSRTPVFNWVAHQDVVNYEVYVNVTRDDYDWYASGNFLDRYVKVGETTSTSLVMPYDLVDRWTYKAYVLGMTSTGDTLVSSINQFGVYIPFLEEMNDGVAAVNGRRDLNKNGTIEPYEDWHLTPEQRLDDLMSRMTLTEKASQLFYGGTENPLDGFAFSYGVESGMRDNQFAAAQSRMGIPIAFMGDKIHGWKTIYPTQLGLAAMRDMDMIYQCGNLHRIEQKNFGFTGSLCPLAEVNTKALYPRIQEGCGENATEAAANVRAIVCGMQGGPEINPHSMLVTVKHWPSQGAGGESALQYDSATIGYHMIPWHAAVEVNAASVMPGYNTSPYLDPDNNGANSSKKIIDYLRDQIHFDGFVVTDWLAANTDQSVESIGAGIDVMGGAPSSLTDINSLVNQIGMERLNVACRRILDMKIRLGMLENPYGDPTTDYVQTEHHTLVLEAAKKSFTLLKNDNGILPLALDAGDNLVVDGQRASWPNTNNDPNVIWQSIYYDDPQAFTYYEAIKTRAAGINVTLGDVANEKVAVVVIGEQSYTHGTEWDEKDPHIPVEQVNIIRQYRDQGVPVVCAIISPRPYILTEIDSLCDAIICLWRPGTAAGQALAQLLFGDFEPSGRLPFQLPKHIDQIGSDNVNDQVEQWELPYDLGATEEEREEIRWYMANNLEVPTNYGDPLYPYGFGLQGFSNEDLTNPEPFNLLTPYDESQIQLGEIELHWEASFDPETMIKEYQVWLDGSLYGISKGTYFTLPRSVGEGLHQWHIVAQNWLGGETSSNVGFEFTVSDTEGPIAFDLIEPDDQTQIMATAVNLKWSSTEDEGVGFSAYHIYVDGQLQSSLAAGQGHTSNANVALGKNTSASTEQNDGLRAALAVDGDNTTRWSSINNEDEYFVVDLGAKVKVGQIEILWEAAYGLEYFIEFSEDSVNWVSIIHETNGQPGENVYEDVQLNARYIQLQGISRGTPYGYSIFEFRVFEVPGVQLFIENMSYGTHDWYVEAVDSNDNVTSSDNWTFTLYQDGDNLPPVVNAGGDRMTTESVITLDGGNSYDPEGQPLSYLWSLISGPSEIEFDDVTSVTPVASGLEQGQYEMLLTVNDGEKSASQQFMITVTLVTGSAGWDELDALVFPNPVHDIVMIQKLKNLNYTLVSTKGETLLSGVLNSDMATIKLAHLSAGLYFLQVGEKVVQLIKE